MGETSATEAGMGHPGPLDPVEGPLEKEPTRLLRLMQKADCPTDLGALGQVGPFMGGVSLIFCLGQAVAVHFLREKNSTFKI